jgi:PRTRC genetic system protein E
MPRNSRAPPITSAEYGQEPESTSEFGYIHMMLTINERAAAKPPSEKENSTMTAEPTGLFQGLAPLLVNRTVIMTVAADGKGLLTLNVIPKKVKDDESDALTTALCITASPEELDRDLATQLREFTDVHAKAACNMQKVKDELAAAERAEREAADERRAKKAKGKVIPPASGADAKPESVKPVGSGQTSLGLFDQADGEPKENSLASTGVAAEQGQVTAEGNDYPD